MAGGDGMTRRQPSARPRALIIATNPAHMELREALVKQGFAVTIVRSLIAGYTQISRLLTADQSPRLTLILLDVTSYDQGFPELDGTILVAAVAAQMRVGSLHPAWIIAMSLAGDTKHDVEALIAGCRRVIHLPLIPNDLLQLGRLGTRPAQIPHAETLPEIVRVIEVLQATALRVLHAVQAVQTHIWTPEEVEMVLRLLTRYPEPLTQSRQATPDVEVGIRIRQLLRTLGGVRSARQRLESIAEQWQSRYPLYGEILRLFLERWERREIVSHFVDQGLYEDSRIYHCIKELPRRICKQFILDQAIQNEVVTDK